MLYKLGFSNSFCRFLNIYTCSRSMAILALLSLMLQCYEQQNVCMTFKICKDKGQGHTANAFQSPHLLRYWP